MKRLSGIAVVLGVIFILQSSRTKEEKPIVHKLSSMLIGSNLIFPTSTPDRIILNLTNDPTHSVAVNWRTDTTILNSLVQVAIATHGPEFVDNTREIEGTRELLTHKPENDPEVS
jgi:hypothetical protein